MCGHAIASCQHLLYALHSFVVLPTRTGGEPAHKHQQSTENSKAHNSELCSTMCRYEQVLPLHQRWRQYMSTLLAGAGSGGGGRGSGQQQQRGSSGNAAGTAGAGTLAEAAVLLGAEMHGCLLRVVECDEQRWQGIEGIVVRDTQQTFVVVTKEGQVLTLPKRRCVFEYGLGRGRVVRLLGRNLVPPVGGSATGSLGAGQRKK